MIVTEAEAAAHFCAKTELIKDILNKDASFVLADIGGIYFIN